jgi:hypothetical protein
MATRDQDLRQCFGGAVTLETVEVCAMHLLGRVLLRSCRAGLDELRDGLHFLELAGLVFLQLVPQHRLAGDVDGRCVVDCPGVVGGDALFDQIAPHLLKSALTDFDVLPLRDTLDQAQLVLSHVMLKLGAGFALPFLANALLFALRLGKGLLALVR